MLSSVPRHTLLAATVFCFGAVADVVTTYVAITSGNFVEGSPIGAFLIGRYGLVRGMVLAKLLGIPVLAVPPLVVGWDRFRIASVVLAGGGLLSALAAIHNAVVYLRFA